MKKKLFLRTLLVSCGIISTMTPVLVFSENAEAATNGKTAEEAIAWVRSKVGMGIDFDQRNGKQCVDLIKAYYNYLGQSEPYGNGADYVKNAKPATWKRLSKSETTPQKGDILIYTGGYGGYGHVAIYESDYSHYHQNWNYHSYVERVTYKYYGDWDIKYWGVIRPDFAASKSTAQSATNTKQSATNTKQSATNTKQSVTKKTAVTGITLNKTKVSLKTGGTVSLTATVKPSNASNKAVTWSSSNKAVAKVDKNGKVTALKSGTATITVKTSDGGKTAKAVINVADPKNGLIYSDGKWTYYTNDKVNKSYTGLVYHNNAWWYIKNGVLDKSYAGLTYCNDAWWYVSNGKLDKSFTGLSYCNDAWWYVSNGKLDKSFTGLSYHNGEWYYINKGKLDKSYTGLTYHGGKWYYIVKGKWSKTYNGKVKYNGKTYTVKNGKVA